MTQIAMDFRSDKYYYRSSWFQLVRPMTLTGTLTPVLVGTGVAATQGPIQFDVFFALLFAALLIQAATNLFNDYYDFRNGQDQDKWTLNHADAHGPSHAVVPYAAGSMLGITIIIGAWLAFMSSFWVILAGILGISFGFLYSAGPRPLCSIGLGETVAFIFLGPVITILGYSVQGHTVDIQIAAISLPFAMLIASMILTNNIRDMEKDSTFRKTLPAILGRARAINILVTLLSIAYLTVVGLVLYNVIAWQALAVLLALPLAFRLRWSLRRGAKRSEEIKGMKWAAWHHWAFGLLFSCGVWIGFLIS
ncbi:prenyltransferase [Virgibacillus litoralis]|uniref:1,4-dihydroxy-2-naphthoate octaprenyltransferase n=1 Tax=Virgibacillus litoralis TaxID=578221 RepID=A0ABS4HBP8_9BACI|nr:prenyltransferase [Virgibacillus litoralis]MBP1947912.1 1,4-dihydroxy-2-naphthoate octaprenyltransferase [Virgibacillus litoralis]